MDVYEGNGRGVGVKKQGKRNAADTDLRSFPFLDLDRPGMEFPFELRLFGFRERASFGEEKPDLLHGFGFGGHRGYGV